MDYETSEPAGTIIVEPSRYELLLIQGGGKALTYPVGVGKAGHSFSGRATVGRKEEWPKWTPTANMIAADPDGKGRLAGGVQGVRRILLALARSICSRAVGTRFIAFTARMIQVRSENPYRVDAFACLTVM